MTATLQTQSFRELLHRSWRAFSLTLVGDIIATAIAIAGITALFLACAFALIGLSYVGHAFLHLPTGL